MQLGMIGLGRMRANLVRRLMRGGHECIVYDLDKTAVKALGGEGAVAAYSLPLLAAGDIVVDGGNDIARAGRLGRTGIHYLDVGTSGGGAPPASRSATLSTSASEGPT